ncbi:protein-S-isoprenylcysteine O-methyltransferase Ste14 [Murinocardiopsis flavida]|uniref:Protein-S-isoprenylcysteine O-methyltransferase Ste14 n=1 Tax=Murinocardiopsis flavida TaxID=645275 RepID=A0A2P8D6V4_9ACTN|nr:methyltransferase [Murinocardiopsis flavida]PSK92919.1 protein-S-isoprenylcysteine O-methyltransferase Ste14 [Murinocardiopsis flavida]
MADPALIRAVAFFGPLLAALAIAAVRPPGRAAVAAAIVGTAWCAASLYALNLLAVHVGWWTFHADGALARGLPVDLWLGWAVLWGALPALVDRGATAGRGGAAEVVLTVAAFGWIDAAVMPLGAPVVVLGKSWLLGEAVALACCLLPAVLLARWTRRGTRVTARMWAQAVLAGALMLGLPLHLLEVRVPWSDAVAGAGLQVLGAVLLPGLAAAREFAAVGRGTPLPYDPPRRLVTGGPYAYVRNPMQLSMALGYACCAVLCADPRLLVGTAVAVGYGAGFAAWHEGAELAAAHGARWARYRAGVRPWLPRLRPWPGRPDAVVYLAEGCTMCSGLARWLAARDPVALRIRAAEDHPEPLRRMAYVGADGVAASGPEALARALEHLHLGWALAGWALALPGVRRSVRFAGDAFGAGPMTPRPVRGAGA